MNWIAHYHANRAQYWDKVEAYFDNLPPHLQRQGRLLRNNLAVHFSYSGEFSDILTRIGDYPQITIPFGILDDCEIKYNPELAGYLFRAAVFIFCTIYTQEDILDERSFFDTQYIFLANGLSQVADRNFKALFPSSSPFWEYHEQFWADYRETILSNLDKTSNIVFSEGSEVLLQRKDLLAPHKLIPGAALLLADRESDLHQIFSALDHFHKAALILKDLTNLKHDLKLGKITYPILKVLGEVERPSGKAYNPQGAYLALMMMEIPSTLIQECLEDLKSCRTIAKTLGLKSLLIFINEQESRAVDIKHQFIQSPESIPETSEYSQKIFMQSPKISDDVNLSDKALEMAEGFLLSDLTFKDSWEVHRHGMKGVAEVISRFPAGLIIEILIHHGFDLSAQVDEFYTQLRENNFSYYDHPDLPYADADTLGVLLRLYRYSKYQDTHRQDLAQPLEWMEKSIDATGRIPVWIYPLEKDLKNENQSVRLLGEGCGTIEAKLLLGLIEFDWEAYQEIVQASATQLLNRFLQQGTGITINYPPQYFLWRINQLISHLNNLPIQASLKTLVDNAANTYTEDLAQEVNSLYTSPQRAAFLLLAGMDSGAQQLNYSKWVSILLKNQHSDGSWNGESMFFVPNRGGLTTWYTSRTLTTAFCYHALKTYRKQYSL